MKAVCNSGQSVSQMQGVDTGRVHKPRPNGENAEIQMYLSKLQDLVPYMPKNRKISKLEVIQNVIDYICELQSALETHPAAGAFDAASVLGPSPATAPRPPLTPLGPHNAQYSLPAAPAPHSPPSMHPSHTSPEKTSQQDRPLSC